MPEHVAEIMIKRYDFYRVEPKPELPAEDLSTLKQSIRESEDEAWLSDQLAIETKGLNRSSVLKAIQTRLESLSEAQEPVPLTKQEIKDSDNPDWLVAQLGFEKEGKNRPSYIGAIEKRLAELNSAE